jgi:hypothetical protein
MMAKPRLLIGVLASLATTSIATGHPGHGTDGGNDSLWHYLTEPVHLAAGLFAVLALAVLVHCVVAVLWKKQPVSEAEET